MANTLTNALPLITARTLEIIRETAVMPKLVNNSYANEARQQGDTIDISLTSTLSTRAVTPGMSPAAVPASNNLVPTKVSLTLDQWHESPFVMTDKELKEVVDGYYPRVLDEAIRAVVNKVDTDILSCYKQFYTTVGTAGTTPFQSSLLEFQEASRALKSNLAPQSDRFVVLDPYAEANLLGVPVMQKVNESGSSQVLRDGNLMGLKALGFDIYCSQNVGTHDTNASGTYAIDAAGTAGDTSIVIDDGAGAAATLLIVGDKFTIAGSTQQYTVTAVTADTPTANEDTYTISPALDQNVSDGDVVTVVSTDYAYNLAFHKDAIAFASRPLLDTDISGTGSLIRNISDPMTGLNLRFEAQRVYKQTYFSIDILYGYTVLRPEFGVVMFG